MQKAMMCMASGIPSSKQSLSWTLPRSLDRRQNPSYMQLSDEPTPPNRPSSSSEPGETRVASGHWRCSSSRAIQERISIRPLAHPAFAATWDNKERQQAPYDATNQPPLAMYARATVQPPNIRGQRLDLELHHQS